LQICALKNFINTRKSKINAIFNRFELILVLLTKIAYKLKIN